MVSCEDNFVDDDDIEESSKTLVVEDSGLNMQFLKKLADEQGRDTNTLTMDNFVEEESLEVDTEENSQEDTSHGSLQGFFDGQG